MIIKYSEFLKESELKSDTVDLSTSEHIKYLKNFPSEYKEIAVKFLKSYSSAKKGKVFGLNLHPDLINKIESNSYPSGFDMGMDKDGYFIHTHRARSKSHLSPDQITAKEIKFIDSTG